MDGALHRLDARLNPEATAPIAVALSGGSDSLALLILALRWARAHGRPVLALSVDHRIQPASADWTRQALATAARLGARTRALAWTGDKPATGLPASARRARHALLAEAARAEGASVVLMGHTRDDLAEAAAMRGEGSTVGSPLEWSPSPVWPEGRGVFVLRPLLALRRDTLRHWLRAEGIEWLEDPANADPRYARARARAALAGRARAGEAGTLPGGLAGIAAVCDADAWGAVRLPLPVLAETSGPRLLQTVIACVSGRETPPRGAKAAALAERLLSGAGRGGLGGARVTSKDGSIYVTREAGEQARGGLAEVALAVAASVVWDGRFDLTGRGRVVALAGRTGALPAEERRRLKSVPAAARGGLPAVIGSTGELSCPLLALGPGASATPLAGDRLRAACGLIGREG